MNWNASIAKRWLTLLLASFTDDIVTSGDITTTGDIAAAGGFRTMVGPFTAPGSAGVLAASQTNLDCRYSHSVTAAASSFVATRAGSIVGLSAQLSAAVTGADVTVAVTKNGTETDLTVSLTATGAETKASATEDKDAITFAAGDVIGVSYTSGAISNTPAMVATVEIES